MSKTVFKIIGVGFVITQFSCWAHCVVEYLGEFIVCSGPSMQPTINSCDVVLAEHVNVRYRRIEKGDVVIARSPSKPKQYVCKRITGMAGDVMENTPPLINSKYIPQGHVWLEGDNKDNSTDSRAYGPVPYALLRSRVFFKIWPLWDFGFVTNNTR